MKLHFLLLVAFPLFVLATEFHETEEEFNKEFNILENDSGLKDKETEKLKEAEEEINEENQKFEKGEATYDEKLYPESNLPEEEFEKEKEGALILPDSEFARGMGLIETPEEERYDPINEELLAEVYDELSRSDVPESYDAVSEGLVTEVKNQRSCGSCAAFSAVAMHETCMIKAGAKKEGLDLSEQQVIDCGYNGRSMDGCNGAYVHAYQTWFAQNGGQAPHEQNLPYMGRSPSLQCPTDLKTWNSGAMMKNAVYDYSCNEEKMKGLVAKYGAVSTALYASSFGNYRSGVFQGCKSQSINHAVLVVGYGTENGIDYWNVKNSWGKGWGEGGYIKIRRGTSECGIGGMCVIGKCKSTDGSEAAPEPEPEPEIPANLKCDISKLFWPGLTGTYSIRYDRDGQQYRSTVKCENSICSPLNPGPSNACMYICGALECKR